MRHFRLLTFMLASNIALPAMLGCAHSQRNWDGKVEQWGTMFEVLGQGQSQGRVEIKDALRRPNAVGLGALEGLQGEVTVLDGHSWVSVGAPESPGACAESPDHQAALLAIAHVPMWVESPLASEIGPQEFDSVIRERAIAAGVDTERPFPFMINGRLSVEAHVVSGSCPHAGASSGAAEPKRISFTTSEESGTLVGFYAEHGEGSLTHHGSNTHVHVVLLNSDPRCGHVDSVTVAAGSIIQFPRAH